MTYSLFQDSEERTNDWSFLPTEQSWWKYVTITKNPTMTKSPWIPSISHNSYPYQFTSKIITDTPIPEHLASRPDRELLPNTDDLIGASESLARLAHVYRLNTTELARGSLLTTVDRERDSSYHTLSSNCFKIRYSVRFELGCWRGKKENKKMSWCKLNRFISYMN